MSGSVRFNNGTAKMKTKKLLARLREFLDAEGVQQRREIKSIREVLKQIKKKQRKLQGKLETDPEREDRGEIQAKLEIVYAQRRKGLERVQALLQQEGERDRVDG